MVWWADASATLYLPYDVAFDSHGNLYIADSGHGRVRMVKAATGVITTVAGDGDAGTTGDGGPATLAEVALRAGPPAPEPPPIPFPATVVMMVGGGVVIVYVAATGALGRYRGATAIASALYKIK